jgi:hypothetical protein
MKMTKTKLSFVICHRALFLIKKASKHPKESLV